MDLGWIWVGSAMDLEWIWGGSGVDLGWFWDGSGMDLGSGTDPALIGHFSGIPLEILMVLSAAAGAPDPPVDTFWTLFFTTIRTLYRSAIREIQPHMESFPFQKHRIWVWIWIWIWIRTWS